MAKNIKIAYIISAYKLAENLISLVSAINSPTSYIVIHIDKNTDNKIYKELKNKLARHPNVHFLRRHRSNYRGFGHVKSSLKGMQYLKQKKIKYDYLFLLTGQDYPIKNENYIKDFLNKNYGRSFMEYFLLPSGNWLNGGADRLNRYYIHLRNGYRSIDRKRLPSILGLDMPENLNPFGGSGYWTLYSKHVDYILKFISDHKQFVRFFKHVDIPDEIFFQTILLNSRYKKDIVNNDIRFIDWSNPKECPAIIRLSDFKKLNASKDIFARKFDSQIDSRIVAKIDKDLLS